MEQMTISMEEKLRARLVAIHTLAPGSIGSQMDFRLVSCAANGSEFTLLCKTFDWMRNVRGTLHGGMCATIVDQAMGFIAYCLKNEEHTPPTVQMSVEYLRPLFPDVEVLVRVRVVSVSRNLIRLSAEVALASAPDKLCLTSTATYFNKPAQNG